MARPDGLRAATEWLARQHPGWAVVSIPAGRGDAYVAVENRSTAIRDWDDVVTVLEGEGEAAVVEARSGGRETFGRVLTRLVDARRQIGERSSTELAERLQGWWPAAANHNEHLVSCRAYGIDPKTDRKPKLVAPTKPEKTGAVRFPVARSGEDQLILEHHASVGGELYFEVGLPGSRRSIDAVISGTGKTRFASERFAWTDHDPEDLTLVEAKVGGESGAETLMGQICAARAGVAHIYERDLHEVGAAVVVERTGPLLEAVASVLGIPVHVVGRAPIATIAFAGAPGQGRLDALRRYASEGNMSETDAIVALLDELRG